MNIIKIISGGQTGADIAGVDAAIECNISYGGWLPKGRKCETGIVPLTYTGFQELTKGGYPKRTEQNVIDSQCFAFSEEIGRAEKHLKLHLKSKKKTWINK